MNNKRHNEWGLESRVGNFNPVNPVDLAEDLAEETGLMLDEVLEFFNEQFGGLDKYFEACADREELGRQLARMNGDLGRQLARMNGDAETT